MRHIFEGISAIKTHRLGVKPSRSPSMDVFSLRKTLHRKYQQGEMGESML